MVPLICWANTLKDKGIRKLSIVQKHIADAMSFLCKRF